ncbi:hypothetical protein C2E23DRAFT_248405 [Lenzites betulinus]|nr:hypothetical protein C2E23DRAFT_247877 [Lenzites betulinus]KAH9851243.1 hypothetical protein C2E23DRAFT_248078 [Lenzites betulinus]KAH9851246.1 hypothetical protein C2E23DRAFT_248405 [Lenzites betulinus]
MLQGRVAPLLRLQGSQTLTPPRSLVGCSAEGGFAYGPRACREHLVHLVLHSNQEGSCIGGLRGTERKRPGACPCTRCGHGSTRFVSQRVSPARPPPGLPFLCKRQMVRLRPPMVAPLTTCLSERRPQKPSKPSRPELVVLMSTAAGCPVRFAQRPPRTTPHGWGLTLPEHPARGIFDDHCVCLCSRMPRGQSSTAPWRFSTA